MKAYYRIILITLVFAAMAAARPENAGAQENGERVDIDRAVGIALGNNHDYKIALEELKAAKEKVNTAWGQLMPILSSEASLMRQGADNGFMSLSDGQYDIKLVQLAFGVNPGAFYNSLNLSRKAYVAAKEEVKRIKSEIEYNVIRSYFDMLLAREVVTMRKESLALLAENLKDVNNLYKTGSVPKFELLQARVQHKSQEPLLFDAENRLKVAADLFNYHLGYDKVKYVPDKAAMEKAYRVPNDDLDSSVARLRETALKNRPEIVQVEMKREMAEHSRNAQSAYYLWPTFSVAGYYGKTKLLPNPVNMQIQTPAGPLSPDFSTITGTDDWQTTWQVRVAATYRWGSLIPTDTAKTQEREQEAKVNEAKEELSRLRRLITISIRSNYSRLLTSYLTIMSQKENVGTAEEGLRIARESYRAGVIKNSELISAEYSLTSARTNYINAVHDYYVALAELKKETGTEDLNTIFER